MYQPIDTMLGQNLKFCINLIVVFFLLQKQNNHHYFQSSEHNSLLLSIKIIDDGEALKQLNKKLSFLRTLQTVDTFFGVLHYGPNLDQNVQFLLGIISVRGYEFHSSGNHQFIVLYKIKVAVRLCIVVAGSTVLFKI